MWSTIQRLLDSLYFCRGREDYDGNIYPETSHFSRQTNCQIRYVITGLRWLMNHSNIHELPWELKETDEFLPKVILSYFLDIINAARKVERRRRRRKTGGWSNEVPGAKFKKYHRAHPKAEPGSLAVHNMRVCTSINIGWSIHIGWCVLDDACMNHIPF